MPKRVAYSGVSDAPYDEKGTFSNGLHHMVSFTEWRSKKNETVESPMGNTPNEEERRSVASALLLKAQQKSKSAKKSDADAFMGAVKESERGVHETSPQLRNDSSFHHPKLVSKAQPKLQPIDKRVTQPYKNLARVVIDTTDVQIECQSPQSDAVARSIHDDSGSIPPKSEVSLAHSPLAATSHQMKLAVEKAEHYISSQIKHTGNDDTEGRYEVYREALGMICDLFSHSAPLLRLILSEIDKYIAYLKSIPASSGNGRVDQGLLAEFEAKEKMLLKRIFQCERIIKEKEENESSLMAKLLQNANETDFATAMVTSMEESSVHKQTIDEMKKMMEVMMGDYNGKLDALREVKDMLKMSEETRVQLKQRAEMLILERDEAVERMRTMRADMEREIATRMQTEMNAYKTASEEAFHSKLQAAQAERDADLKQKVREITEQKETELMSKIDIVKQRLRAEHEKTLRALEEEVKKRANETPKVFYPTKQRSPTGNVTLVFTDIQGSTVLWEKLGKVMATSLVIHNEIMRAEIRTHQGYEVKTQGDSFMIAFHTPQDCLRCCFSIQRKLLQVPWAPELANDDEFGAKYFVDPKTRLSTLYWFGLRVRMGMHVGEPICELDPTNGRMDYFGPMVNKTARVESAAPGGTVYMSKEAYDILLPESAALEMISQYVATVMLKGIGEPQQIFQALPSELAGRFLDFETGSEKKTNAPDNDADNEEEEEEIPAPLGRVTVLFCSVYGKSQVEWTEPEAFVVGMGIYSRKISQLSKLFKGYISNYDSDKYQIIFRLPIEALTFALNLQSSLIDCHWPDLLCKPLPAATRTDAGGYVMFRGLRVQIGIHICQVETANNLFTNKLTYMGIDVNMAAALCNAAEGGEILLSEVMYDGVRASIGESGVRAIADRGATVKLKNSGQTLPTVRVFPTDLQGRREMYNIFYDEAKIEKRRKRAMEKTTKDYWKHMALLRGTKDNLYKEIYISYTNEILFQIKKSWKSSKRRPQEGKEGKRDDEFVQTTTHAAMEKETVRRLLESLEGCESHRMMLEDAGLTESDIIHPPIVKISLQDLVRLDCCSQRYFGPLRKGEKADISNDNDLRHTMALFLYAMHSLTRNFFECIARGLHDEVTKQETEEVKSQWLSYIKTGLDSDLVKWRSACINPLLTEPVRNFFHNGPHHKLKTVNTETFQSFLLGSSQDEVDHWDDPMLLWRSLLGQFSRLLAHVFNPKKKKLRQIAPNVRGSPMTTVPMSPKQWPARPAKKIETPDVAERRPSEAAMSSQSAQSGAPIQTPSAQSAVTAQSPSVQSMPLSASKSDPPEIEDDSVTDDEDYN